MKPAFSLLIPFLVAVAGCLSAPIPEELTLTGDRPPGEPLLLSEVVRLSRIGISDLVIVEMIRNRGIAERPDLRGIVALRQEGLGEPVVLALLASPLKPSEPQPMSRMVTREWFIPIWPAYSRGHWHWGLRVACSYHVVDKEVREIRPHDSDLPEIPQGGVDP